MRCWSLDDGRIGNKRQIEAITYYLKDKFEIIDKKLEFNAFANFPNMFANSLSIEKNSRVELCKDFPELIITAGRRAAPIASWIKKKSAGKTKLVQILKPEISSENFDIIITPKHDNFEASNYEYLITPNLVSEQIKKTKNHYLDFSNQHKNFVVYIGGRSKNNKITKKTYLNLIDQLNLLKLNHNCKLYISTSRRTSHFFTAILKQEFSSDFIYDFTSETPNPHYELLAKADKVFVTGDSISMISEAVSSLKPTIFFPEFSANKHEIFIKQLVKKNLIISYADYKKNNFSAKLLNNNIIPNEAKEIADFILKEFKL